MTKNWARFPLAEPTGEDLANFSAYRIYERSAIAGYGVLDGCVVTRTSATEVAISSGNFTISGVSTPFAGASLSGISAASSGYHRYDLVYIDGTDSTQKIELGVEEVPDTAIDFLENYHPRPAEPTDTDWIALAVIRVTENGIENADFGTIVYAQDSIADMRLSPVFAVDDATLQVINGVTSVKASVAHATSHKSGGSDSIKLDELASPTDVTTLNVSTSVHGFCPKAPAVVTQFLNGLSGGWAVPNVSVYGPYRITHDGGASQDILTTPALCEIDEIVVKCQQAGVSRTVDIGWVTDINALMSDGEVPHTLNGATFIRNPIAEITSETALIATIGGSGDGEWDIWLKISRYE